MSRTLLIKQIGKIKDGVTRDQLIRLERQCPSADGWNIHFTIDHDEASQWEIRVIAQKGDDTKNVRCNHDEVKEIKDYLIKTGAARLAFQKYLYHIQCEVERARMSLFGPDRPHYLDVRFQTNSIMEKVICSTLAAIPTDKAIYADGTSCIQFGYSSFDEADRAKRMLTGFKVMAEVHDLTSELD